MAPPLRLFVAVSLPDDVADVALRYLDPLREGEGGGAISWVRRAALHVTLRFLGDTDPTRVPAVEAALAEACLGESPFDVEIRGGGAFPNPTRPRVLWLGLQDGGRLGQVADRLEVAFDRHGLGRADKAFRPHLTVGRVREGRSPGRGRVDVVAALQRAPCLGMFPVGGVTLYRSDLLPQGARHAALARHTFNGV